ncbi:MAG: S1-like domain-containing RNA-binding protein [Verrucomicrobiales bacterium]
MAQLGKTDSLVIIRESDNGFYLDGGELGEILLPSREIPEEVEQGDRVEVFVSRDSEDRLVATTTSPLCEADQFAALVVVSVNPKIGAFLDWGLAKDLLLPFREQTRRVAVGERVVVRVMVDKKSDRIIATTKTNRFLDRFKPNYDVGDKVKLIIQARSPLGYNAIVDQQFRGLLYKNAVGRSLEIGETPDGYVRDLRDDGKIDLSLEPVGYGRVGTLSERILAALQEHGGRLELGDRSSPEAIRAAFGTSKKAFKQAVGSLYRDRVIRLIDDGIELVDSTGS